MIIVNEVFTGSGEQWGHPGITDRYNWLVVNVGLQNFELAFDNISSDTIQWVFKNETDATAYALHWNINEYNKS